MSDFISRSGHFVKQPQGFSAFIPAPLPPARPLGQDQEIARLLSDAVKTAREIINLRETTRQKVTDAVGNMTGALPLLDYLFVHPAVTANQVKAHLNISFAQANKILSRFEELGLINETTGQKRNRRFRFDPYLDLFHSPEASPFDTISDPTQA